MKYIPLTMVRDHLEQLPSFVCPTGYTIRSFRPGDDEQWTRIEALAGEFATENQALRRFHEEFHPRWSELEDRCFLLQNEQGVAIGTATAWDGDLEGKLRGRVHWVGIAPAYQGRGLAKPLLSAVMARLSCDHQSAYLTTQTTSYRAVNLYLNFGFRPRVIGGDDEEGWSMMERTLQRRILP